MKPLRIRDIIGPIMIGPSSSHTAGALRIALMAQQLFQKKPVRVEFLLYGSFAHTYQGHGTDRALVGGILGFDTDDLRIRESLELAREAGVEILFTPRPDDDFEHPNTVDIIMYGETGESMIVRGESIGGGSAILRQIDGIDVYITGEHNSLIVIQHDEKGVLAHIATVISEHDVNIATTRVYREHRGERAYTIIETDETLSPELREQVGEHPAVKEVRIIPADGIDANQTLVEPTEADFERFEALDFPTGEALLSYCTVHNCSISEAFLEREKALAHTFGRETTVLPYLDEVLAVMRDSTHRPASEVHPSLGGLIGGEASKLMDSSVQGAGVIDTEMATLTRYALAVLETNASMGRIVAAPTAGSSGVIPATLLMLQEFRGFSDEAIKRGLITAAAIGYLITRNATVSGAEGGCQAEIGSAAAMAAAAAVELAGGNPAQCFAAASNALTNMMGLVCDPIGGLVEAPCQKRNASGAATALVSAEIALASVVNLVGFDETVEAMHKVGRSLPFELRETGLGGLAAAPSARSYCSGCSACSNLINLQ